MHAPIKLLALAAILASCAHLPHVDPAPRAPDAIARATMDVLAECTPMFGDDYSAPPPDRRGTAVVIDERHAITAYHVAHCPFGQRVTGWLSTGRRVMLHVDREDEGADLARLEIATADNFGIHVAPPVVGAARAGDGACSAAWGATRCGVVGSSGAAIAGSWLTVPGDSGSGLYVGGELVGIMVRQITLRGMSVGGEAAPLEGHADWFAP